MKTIFTLMAVLALAAQARAQAPQTQPVRTVRVAVIGGMNDTGFWDGVSAKFEAATHIHVQVVASGQKDGITSVFKQGGIDLITMHACDTILDLVADGWATDPQPWARNDMVIVGPADDPAGIKGMTDASAALQKIADSKSPFVVHSSVGAQEVLEDLTGPSEIEFDPAATTVLFEDRQRRVGKIAAEKKAYTLLGRIPFRSGKIPSGGLIVEVMGDPRLRRPFVVAIANPNKIAGAHLEEARRLSSYLRSPELQQWIGTFARGKYDDEPLFFPVNAVEPTTAPAGGLLQVSGQIAHPMSFDAAAIAAMRHEVKVIDHHSGKPVTYGGVMMSDLLVAAGAPIGGDRLRGPNLALAVVAEGSDGFRAVYSLTEFDETYGKKEILLADQRDGKPLESTEGPLRMVVPGDEKPARWVRSVVRVSVVSVE